LPEWDLDGPFSFCLAFKKEGILVKYIIFRCGFVISFRKAIPEKLLVPLEINQRKMAETTAFQKSEIMPAVFRNQFFLPDVN